jgi:hypothetical protein
MLDRLLGSLGLPEAIDAAFPPPRLPHPSPASLPWPSGGVYSALPFTTGCYGRTEAFLEARDRYAHDRHHGSSSFSANAEWQFLICPGRLDQVGVQEFAASAQTDPEKCPVLEEPSL